MGATTEDMAWELIWMGAEYFRFTGVTRARAVELLLERAEDAIADILYETYYAQDEGKPAATLGEIDKMRQAVTEFYDQARHLVQPRLAGSRWPYSPSGDAMSDTPTKTRTIKPAKASFLQGHQLQEREDKALQYLEEVHALLGQGPRACPTGLLRSPWLPHQLSPSRRKTGS